MKNTYREPLLQRNKINSLLVSLSAEVSATASKQIILTPFLHGHGPTNLHIHSNNDRFFNKT